MRPDRGERVRLRERCEDDEEAREEERDGRGEERFPPAGHEGRRSASRRDSEADRERRSDAGGGEQQRDRDRAGAASSAVRASRRERVANAAAVRQTSSTARPAVAAARESCARVSRRSSSRSEAAFPGRKPSTGFVPCSRSTAVGATSAIETSPGSRVDGESRIPWKPPPTIATG